MKGSKRKHNWSDSKIGKIIMKLKKLATAIEVQKGPEMDIDDVIKADRIRITVSI